MTSDYFLVAIPAIFLKMILELYLGLMAYFSIFGIFTFIMPFKDYQGAQVAVGGSGRRKRRSNGFHSYAEQHSLCGRHYLLSPEKFGLRRGICGIG